LDCLIREEEKGKSEGAQVMSANEKSTRVDVSCLLKDPRPRDPKRTIMGKEFVVLTLQPYVGPTAINLSHFPINLSTVALAATPFGIIQVPLLSLSQQFKSTFLFLFNKCSSFQNILIVYIILYKIYKK